MAINTITAGLWDILLQQLKERGLSIMILFAGMIYFGWRNDTTMNLIMSENKALKDENKELRTQFYGQLAKNQTAILEEIKEIKWEYSNKKKGAQYE